MCDGLKRGPRSAKDAKENAGTNPNFVSSFAHFATLASSRTQFLSERSQTRMAKLSADVPKCLPMSRDVAARCKKDETKPTKDGRPSCATASLPPVASWQRHGWASQPRHRGTIGISGTNPRRNPASDNTASASRSWQPADTDAMTLRLRHPFPSLAAAPLHRKLWFA